MAEFDNDSENTSSNSSMESVATSNLFIKIKVNPKVAYARDLRLKEGDIILANDGKIFNRDINEFRELCDQAHDSERQQLLLTVCRGEVVFDLLVGAWLGIEFDYCDAESSSATCNFGCSRTIMLGKGTTIVIMKHFGIFIGMLFFMIRGILPPRLSSHQFG